MQSNFINMENKENIIDFGSITVPRSWDELDLKTFQEIESYYSDKDKEFDVRDVLHILIHKDVDFINSIPYEFTESILEKLSWLGEEPKYDEPTNKVEINGELYKVNVQEKLRTGEFVAVDTILKHDKHNYAAILAILCRKDDEQYDSKFENEVMQSRVEMWERQPVMKVMPIVTFFLTLWLTSNQLTQLYSMVEEALNLSAESIENSRKNGDLSAWSTLLLKRKLKKLRKSIPHI